MTAKPDPALTYLAGPSQTGTAAPNLALPNRAAP